MNLFATLVLLHLGGASCEALCGPRLTVDITDGVVADHGVIRSHNVSFPRRSHFSQDGRILGCVCDIRRCIRKCCPLGEAMMDEVCTPHQVGLEIDIHDGVDVIERAPEGHFFFIAPKKGENPCFNSGSFSLAPVDYKEDAFYIQKDGKMFFPANERSMLPQEDFCVEMFINNASRFLSAMICDPDVPKTPPGFLSFGMIISMPFLLITFIVYAVLPDRNLHGKSLMCYVISLFGAYVLLVIIQMSPHKLENNLCIGIGLSCLFCFMASFFWMNVMSIDIWWAFRGMRGISGSRKEAEQKRFLLYCLYAWGMPVVHVLLVLFLILVADLPPYAWYNPQFGNGKCWFKDGIPTFLYFFGPISALIITNIVLFVITACKINMVQRDTAVLRKDENKRHSYENDKQRFNLYLKLMLAMGVNWSMEIISWAVIYWQVGNLPTYIWYLTDACNALYGVVIFFIFVFKRNIWKLLKRRYYLVTGRPHLARSVTQNAYSPRTTTSTLSHTIDSKSGNYTTESSVYTSEVA